MVTTDENISKLQNVGTRDTSGDSGITYVKKCGDYQSYQNHEWKLHRVALADEDVIPGLHVNLFRVKISLDRGIKVNSEGKALILNKIEPNFCLAGKCTTPKVVGLFWQLRYTWIQMTPLFWDMIRKVLKENHMWIRKVWPSIIYNKQEQQKISIWEIQINKFHKKLIHRIHVTLKHLHYSIMGGDRGTQTLYHS